MPSKQTKLISIMKQYRITFRVELFVNAETEKEAMEIFEQSDFKDDPTAEFVEFISIDETN